jgi:ABC-type iron transport system FetAB ATPase subunit
MLTIHNLSSDLLPNIDSLEVLPGQCLAIHGESGSGKTLLLRAIADLDPNHANIELNHQSRDAMSADEWRNKVIYLPAESFWWSDQVLAHFNQRLQPETLGLSSEISNWQVSRLSTGEKQRLALLRALDREPSVLLMDETTANLDQENTLRVEKLIATKCAEGLGVIWVSHDPQQRQRIADKSYRIDPTGLRED